MTDATDFLNKMNALADATVAAAAGDPITSARRNAIAASADNAVQAKDGVHSIAFDAGVGDNAFTLTYDASDTVLTLRNLTSGEILGLDIGATAIAENTTQAVRFDSLGATVTLNNAFDKAADISDVGGEINFARGSADIEPGSIKLIDASGSGAQGLTSNELTITAVAGDSATISIGNFSAEGVDLSASGVVQASLTDGTDSFTIEFLVTSSFSTGDDVSLDVKGLGAMVLADAGVETAPATDEDAFVTFAAATLNGLAAEDNLLEAADGFQSIAFDGVHTTGAFRVSYDASTGVLRLDNLTTGMVQGVDIDRTLAFSAGDTQTIDFDAVGATIVLNDAFDKATTIGGGGAVALSLDGGAGILPSSIEITSASGQGGKIDGDPIFQIDVASVASATISVDAFSATGVDLSATGVVRATLTDGTDSFEIEFLVTSAFSNDENASFTLPELGQLVFSTPATFDEFTGAAAAERVFGTDLADALDGGGGGDDLAGFAGDDTLDGGDGDDALDGGAGDDVLIGGAGVDAIDGGAGADRLVGASGADDLDGGAGDDRIFGNSGGDRITGGGGDDILTGSFAGDMFVIGTASGTDRITDFATGEDKVDLSAYGFAEFAEVLALTGDVDGAAHIVLNGGLVTVILDGVLKAELSADDFLLTTAAADAFDAARVTAEAATNGAPNVDIPAPPAAPAAAGDLITVARQNSIASSADNFVQAQDGVHSIAFAADVGDNAYTLTFSQGVLTLRNLTTGEIESVDIGFTSIAENAVQEAVFETLGATISLNSAFDHVSALSDVGGAFSASGGPQVIDATIKLVEATGSGAQGVTSNAVLIQADSLASDATLSIGGFSANGVDLSDVGLKTATLTDGTDSFTVEFFLQTAFSDGDVGALEVNGLGAMVFADADIAPETAAPGLVQGFTRVDATLNGLGAGANRLEAADGFASFSFDADVENAVFQVSFDADTDVLRIDNLTTGEVQGVDIGVATALSVGETHAVDFDALGVSVVLNDAFDPEANIPLAGGGVFSAGGSASVLASSIELVWASADAGADLTDTTIAINAVSAGSASLQVGDYQASGVDLTSAGRKTVTLSDGEESFSIQFQVITAFSSGDDVAIDLPQLGQLLFSDPVTPVVHRGGAAAETFAGGDGDDTAFGAGGDDDLSGGGGADILVGGDGQDTLDGGVGADILNGGLGDDTFLVDDAGDRIVDIGGEDTVVSSVSYVLRFGVETLTLATGAGDIDGTGNSQDDTINGNEGANVLKGGAGDDTLAGGAGDDTLLGHAGADDLDGGDGADFLRGDDGADTLAGGAGDDILFGMDGDDSVAGGAGADILRGQLGDDDLDGGDGDDHLNGQEGDDRVVGGLGADKLIGQQGADELLGGAGDDRLYGNSGDDRIDGGAGADAMLGSFGADVFVFAPGDGIDTIVDFTAGEDRIDLSAYGFANFAALAELISDINGRAQINLDGNADVARLNGVLTAELSADDFLLA